MKTKQTLTGTQPQATFSLQAVVSNFPTELHEAIDMTPAIRRWAQEQFPTVAGLYNAARGRESIALRASRGEGSWRRNNGPQLARSADSLQIHLQAMQLLADGKVANGSFGWVDRLEWRNLGEITSQ